MAFSRIFETVGRMLMGLLLTEFFKSLNHLNPEIMWTIFKGKSSKFNLRSGSNLILPRTNTQKYGINSLRFRATILDKRYVDFFYIPFPNSQC